MAHTVQERTNLSGALEDCFRNIALKHTQMKSLKPSPISWLMPTSILQRLGLERAAWYSILIRDWMRPLTDTAV